jgi:hypothetical protein
MTYRPRKVILVVIILGLIALTINLVAYPQQTITAVYTPQRYEVFSAIAYRNPGLS